MQVRTIDDIVEEGLELRPKDASYSRASNFVPYCTTGLFEGEISGPQGIKVLDRRQGKWLGCYARVSTERQNTRSKKETSQNNTLGKKSLKDGFSMRDQLTRMVWYAYQHGLAFRVYSDAELSGGLPTNDAKLIVQLFELHAANYRAAMQNVLLPEYGSNHTPEQKVQVEAYLKEKVAWILGGAKIPGEAEPEWETNWQELDIVPVRTRSNLSRDRVSPVFRPGLTTLIQELHHLHGVVATDMSRISRSVALTAEITRRLEKNNVMYIGLMEKADWMNEKGLTKNVMQSIVASQYESKLYEACMNSIRGIVAKLESGRPHGQLPFWLRRDTDDFAVLRDGRNSDGSRNDSDYLPNGWTYLQLLEYIVDLYMAVDSQGEDADNGFATVASRLNLASVPTVRTNHDEVHSDGIGNKRKVWTGATIQFVLHNPALIGRHNAFGIEWAILPAPISQERFYEIKERIALRRNQRIGRPLSNARVDTPRLRGLIKCKCGRAMFSGINNNVRVYRCSLRRHSSNTSMAAHGYMFQDDADHFFDNLMENHYDIPLDALRTHSTNDKILDEISNLKQLLAALQAERITKAASAWEAASKELVEDGILPNDPDYTGEAEKIVLRKCKVLDRQIVEAKEALADAGVKANLYSNHHLDELRDVARHYCDLDAEEKNKILRRFFKEIEFAGEPGNEYLSIKLYGPGNQKLPPLYFHSRVSGRGVSRRFPSVAEWVASWITRLITVS